MRRVLVLGGTGEARELAAALHLEGVPVISSLAGRVPEPLLPAGEVRIGGFGGPGGLARWLAASDVGTVVDASHPFASRISASAASACARAGVPLTRLERPGFTERPGDRWHRVDGLEAAAAGLGALGRRALVTTGRLEASAFAAVHDAWLLLRCISRPEPPLPPRHEILLDRGPYTLDGELALIDRHRIDVLVTKDSGGDRVSAKLEAARLRGLPVLLVRRPPPPDAPTVHSVPEVLHRLEESR